MLHEQHCTTPTLAVHSPAQPTLQTKAVHLKNNHAMQHALTRPLTHTVATSDVTVKKRNCNTP